MSLKKRTSGLRYDQLMIISCMVHACMHAIQVVKIKHPSEKANNPVDEVLFYGKAKTPNDLPETLSKNFALRKV